METELLKEFEKLYQLQESIAGLVNQGLYDSLGTTDTHCIDFIGDMQEANGVEIASQLGMTRGAISKRTTRLENKGYIKGVKKENNKKEIFYSLTEQGQDIYNQHKKAHNDWLVRDGEFLKTIPKEEQEIVLKTLQNFNTYIVTQMEKIKNDN